MKKNITITWANEKGGVGKTTLCTLFANYLIEKKVALTVEPAFVNDRMLTVAVQDTDISHFFLNQIIGEERTQGGLAYATFLIRPCNSNVLLHCCMILKCYSFKLKNTH